MLTTQQLLTFKSAILAQSAVAPFLASGDYGAVASYYNQPSSTIVWKTSVTQDEIMQNGFNWTRVDNLSVGKARIWEWLFNNDERAINPSKGNVRAGIDATWVGTQADLDQRAAIYVHCKRAATRYEALFSVGTGTVAAPSVLGTGHEGTSIEGEVSFQTVLQALSTVG